MKNEMKEKKMAINYFHNDDNCMSQGIVKQFSVYYYLL